MAALTAALLSPLAGAQAQTPTPKPSEPVAPPNPQPTPMTQTQQREKPSPLALAYMEVARTRFGRHLSAEDLERIERELEGNVRTTERLRSFKLSNADEPDFVFIP